MLKGFFIKALPVVLVSTLLVAAIIYAWIEPTGPPPTGNVPAPINVGGNPQYKAALLGVEGLLVSSSTFLAVYGGNVGIGTTSMNYKLDISGALRLIPSSVPAGANGVMHYDSVSNKFRCYQNGAWVDCIGAGAGGGHWMALGDDIYNTNTGNVGIGATSTGAKLHIAETGSISGANALALTEKTSGNVARLITLFDTTSNEIRVAYGGASAGVALIAGDDPTRIFDNVAAGANEDLHLGAEGHLRLYSGLQDWATRKEMIFTSAGRVGIGTTGPAQELHVVGNARITGVANCLEASSKLYTNAAGDILCGTDQTGAGGAWICTNHDGTGLSCSGDNLYIETYYRGAEARCGVDDFLDGDGDCRSPAQIVTAGGGGGGSYSWDLYEDGTFRDTITDGEDVGFDSGTGIAVSWDGSRDIRFNLVDATKSCGATQAIQSFNLSGTGNPTCVAAGGVSAQTTRSCSQSTTNANAACTTASCPAGYVRSGCSVKADGAGKAIQQVYSQPSGSSACYCHMNRQSVIAFPPTITLICYTYCVQ